MKKIEHACVYSCNPTQTAVYFDCLCVTVTRSFCTTKEKRKTGQRDGTMKLKEWNARLHGLVIFRTLLEDPVLA